MSASTRIVDLIVRWQELREQGEAVTAEELCADCPELATEVERRLRDLASFAAFLQHESSPSPAGDSADLYGTTVTGPPRRGDETVVAAPAGVRGYEILEELGRGGMGVVYKARQAGLKRIVALKMILAGGHAGPDDIARFRTEAEAVARLQHPHIVQIHEIGEQEGLPYFSLEYVAGGTLAQKIQGTPLPPREAAAIAETLARAVHAAHQNGMIHRDLKPANVLITADGTPKITDFGLAKRVADDSGQTRTGAVMGTPSYMAPEQASGKTREVGPAADVYALDAILYEMLTGRPPFRGTSAWETVAQVVEQEPVPPRKLQPTVPRDAETICLKCLQKAPAKRYVDAAALAEDLRRFQAGEPILGRPIGPVERLHKWVRRRPLVSALGAAVLLVSVIGLAAFGWAFGEVIEARDDALNEQDKTARALAATDLARRQAVLDRGRADDARKAADSDRKKAEAAEKQRSKQLYRSDKLLYASHIAEAEKHLRNLDFVQCRAALDECRWDFRGPEYDYLANGVNRNTRTLIQPGGVSCLALSPDGKRLFAGGYDAITVWDTTRGEISHVLPGHSSGVDKLVMSADGKCLASVGSDKTFKDFELLVWDIAPGNTPQMLVRFDSIFSPDSKFPPLFSLDRPGLPLADRRLRPRLSLALSEDGKSVYLASTVETTIFGVTLEKLRQGVRSPPKVFRNRHSAGITGVALSGNGKRLVSAGEKAIVVWDIDDGDSQVLRGHDRGIEQMALNREGTRLVSTDGFQVVVWDVQSGKVKSKWPMQRDSFESMALSGDGKHLFSGHRDGSVTWWDMDTGRPLRRFRGHDKAVRGLAVSENGKQLYSGSLHGGIKIWDLDLHENKSFLGVRAVALTRDGKRLFSASSRIEEWDLASGTVNATLHGHDLFINALALSPDERYLVSGGYDKTVKVWDLAKRKELRTLRGHTNKVNCVAFCPLGKFVFSADEDKFIRIWHLETGKQTKELAAHEGGVSALAMGKGTKLYSAGSEGIKVWDLESGSVHRELRQTSLTTCLLLDPLEKRLFAGDFDGTTTIWDVESAREILTLRGHAGPVRSLALSSDGTRLLSGGDDKTIKIWDLDVGKALITLHTQGDGVQSLGLSGDGRRLIAGGSRGLEFWNLKPQQETLVLRRHAWGVIQLWLDPDGKHLFSASGDTTVRSWDLATGQDAVVFRGHAGMVTSLAGSADGTRIFSGSADRLIKVWDTATGEEVTTLRGHAQEVTRLALALGGKRLCSGDLGGSIKLWNTDTGREESTLAGHKLAVLSLATSADGTLLYSGSADKTIKVWNLATGRHESTLVGHTDEVVGLALSHDGTSLCSASIDGIIKVWDLKTARDTLTLKGSEKGIGLALGRDGTLYFGADGGAIQVWNLRAGKLERTLLGHSGTVMSLVLSLDGNRLYSCSLDRTIRVWNLVAP